MYLAHGARALAAGILGVAVVATAAAGLALTPPGPGPGGRVQASVIITPGVRHLQREARQSPSTTAECEQSLQIACYNPAQVQQAYNLPVLYSRGVTGKGATIVIVDPYGSPTIASDLRAFDSAEGVPGPPSLRIIRPAGKVPAFNPNNANMVGWASETTLDVEYAHTIAPGAKILLVETPGGGRTGTVRMQQIVSGEKYVIRHHSGDVISQQLRGHRTGHRVGRDPVAARRLPGRLLRPRHGTGRRGGQRRDRVRVEPAELLHPSRDVLARQRPAGDRRRRHPPPPERQRQAQRRRHGMERYLQPYGEPAGQRRQPAEPAGPRRRQVGHLRAALVSERRRRRLWAAIAARPYY